MALLFSYHIKVLDQPYYFYQDVNVHISLEKSPLGSIQLSTFSVCPLSKIQTLEKNLK